MPEHSLDPTADNRAATNPLFNGNTFKLGLFCHNASVIQMSTAPEKYSPTWSRSLEIGRLADAIGLEVIVSFAGWRGAYPDDPKHCSHREYEPFTWAAAVGAVTKHPAIIGTFHTQLTHRPSSPRRRSPSITSPTAAPGLMWWPARAGSRLHSSVRPSRITTPATRIPKSLSR